MPSLSEFLKRNTIVAGQPLPLLHSFQAYRIKEFRDRQSIEPVECDVFKDEKLNYFFMGRPAYKVTGSDAQAAHWELPCCFIFEYENIEGIRRIFPFDTGAHAEQRYPNYIGMMDNAEFDVSDVNDGPARIIGAFFGDARAYFDLRPKSEEAFEAEFALGPLEAEVAAVHRLAGDNRAANGFDDRRLTIEVQSDAPVDLKVTRPLAVILPAKYLDDPTVLRTIEEDWNAEVLSYPIFSLSLEQYYATIYAKVLDFYQKKHLL